MEIIADIGTEERLVKLTRNEIALIMGFNGPYDSAFERERMCKIGAIIDVEKFHKISSGLRTTNVSILQEALSKIERAQAGVAEALHMINEINCFEKLKE